MKGIVLNCGGKLTVIPGGSVVTFIASERANFSDPDAPKWRAVARTSWEDNGRYPFGPTFDMEAEALALARAAAVALAEGAGGVFGEAEAVTPKLTVTDAPA